MCFCFFRSFSFRLGVVCSVCPRRERKIYEMVFIRARATQDRCHQKQTSNSINVYARLSLLPMQCLRFLAVISLSFLNTIQKRVISSHPIVLWLQSFLRKIGVHVFFFLLISIPKQLSVLYAYASKYTLHTAVFSFCSKTPTYKIFRVVVVVVVLFKYFFFHFVRFIVPI